MDKLIQDLKRRLDILELFVQNNLKNKSFGQLYQDDSGGSITTTTAGIYYPILLGWSLGLFNILGNNLSLGQLSCNERAEGTYLILAKISASTSTNNTEVHMAAHKNGIKLPAVSSEIFIQNASTEFLSIAVGIAQLSGTDYLDLRIASNRNAEVIDLSHIQLVAYRIK